MKKFLLNILIILSLATPALAANIFGFTDPPGCEGNDPFLPVLVICGRNPSSMNNQCQQYSQPCSMGDLVETGSRFIVWLISLVLLIVPLFIMYYGAMIIINRQMDGNIDLIKQWRGKLWHTILYFILMLAAWLIVRTVVDVFQVEPRINTFLIDENGQPVKARPFNTN